MAYFTQGNYVIPAPFWTGGTYPTGSPGAGNTAIGSCTHLDVSVLAQPKILSFSVDYPSGVTAGVEALLCAPASSGNYPGGVWFRGGLSGDNGIDDSEICEHGGIANMATLDLTAGGFAADAKRAILAVDLRGSSGSFAGASGSTGTGTDEVGGLETIDYMHAFSAAQSELAKLQPGLGMFTVAASRGAINCAQALARGLYTPALCVWKSPLVDLSNLGSYNSAVYANFQELLPSESSSALDNRSPLKMAQRGQIPVMREGKPIQHVILQGLDDATANPDSTQAFAEILRSQGAQVALHLLAGEGHTFSDDAIVAAKKAIGNGFIETGLN